MNGDGNHGRRTHLTVPRLIALVSGLMLPAVLGATRVSAATIDVCPSGCTYSQIADAVAAASNGDTISVAKGTYRGGFTIDKDLILMGMDAEHTTIRGGGPVLTVGVYNAAHEPTVAIRGVTITGGRTHSTFGASYNALGGGIWVPPGANNATGATVTIRDSVVTGNTAAPTSTVPSNGAACPGGPCPFALAGGGGIDNWGTLMLQHTTVSNNRAGGLASDADGAGIFCQLGSLTLSHSLIRGNHATAASPNGRFAEGGGIMVDNFFSPPGSKCSLTVRDSVVSGNSASLTSSLPSFADAGMTKLIAMNANSGGIHVGDSMPATTVADTVITGNTVTAIDPEGEPLAFDAAMLVGDTPLVMRDTHISDNRAAFTAATTADVGPGGSALELDGPGTITRTTISDNRFTARSPNGLAGVNGALAVLNFNGDAKLVTVQDSRISNNTSEAISKSDSATVQGGGIYNDSLLRLRNVDVTGNSGRANGSGGVAQGGGIWNGIGLESPGSPLQLTLENTNVTENVLTGTDGITVQGGGLFTTSFVTLVRTRIVDNRPDQCVGC